MPAAMTAMALLCLAGNGVAKNKNRAADWFAKAAEAGDFEAVYHLAVYKMEAADADWCEIVSMLEQAAEHGNEAAVLKLAYCYLEGKGTAQRGDEAIATLKKMADKGHDDAMYELGMLYINGKYAEVNKGQAVKWLEKAGRKNNAAALCQLAEMYAAGNMVAQNNKKCTSYYQRAAELGNGKALYHIAEELLTAGNMDEAVSHLQKATEVEFAPAFNKLGELALAGQCGDVAAAVEYFKSGAAMLDAAAMENLAKLYEEGNGVRKNIKKAQSLREEIAAL